MDIAQCLTEPQAIKHLLSILSAKTDNLEISADIRKMRYLGCYGKVEECRRVLLLLVTAAERGYRGLIRASPFYNPPTNKENVLMLSLKF
jgi:hypothetical protein